MGVGSNGAGRGWHPPHQHLVGRRTAGDPGRACTWGLRRLRKSRSNVFIRCEVSATGRKSFSSLGRFFFGTGTMRDVFQRVGTLPICRLRLKIRCSGSPSSAAQVFSSLGHTLSGPAAFLGRSFLSCPLTWSVVMSGEDCVDVGEEGVVLWCLEGDVWRGEGGVAVVRAGVGGPRAG
ncbi:hypothetical protein L3Q82_005179 [Scortum barcoo]|uniref:Uncharacterized protein n=1 Tax=Scortum barcoo TaxID=214431 RepID=A0ACB8VBP8_9TELE|nr:hypothetical protein L3Q82_005179 [Scortum barcoo]